MKTLKASKDLSLKDGSTIMKSTLIAFIRPGDMPTVGIWSVNGMERKMRYRSILRQPSIKSLQKWSEDGICKSVFGARVEPDGYGQQGEPSWLLAMGMI